MLFKVPLARYSSYTETNQLEKSKPTRINPMFVDELWIYEMSSKNL